MINNEIKVYPLGEFCPIDSKWQKEKCKILNLTFISGILFENQSSIKNIDIRCLAPCKEKRIAPDGNCLFSSLSYILTGNDRSHKEIRVLLLEHMKGLYRDICTRYCNSHYDLLPENRCHSVDDYISKSRMDSNGSWGTDMEIFLAAQILKMDIFVFRDNFQSRNKFSGYGFVDKHNAHDLTEERIYMRLCWDHYQPIVKVDRVENCKIYKDSLNI